jgi:hypothetical protein
MIGLQTIHHQSQLDRPMQRLPTTIRQKSSNLLFMEDRTRVDLTPTTSIPTPIPTPTPTPKTKKQMGKRYYLTSDGKYIESTVDVDLDWLSMNLAKDCILTDHKPTKVDYRV